MCFHDLTKSFIVGFFMDTVQAKFFPTLHDYNLAWGIPIHIRFDDIDLVSWLHVCQNHKLFFSFFNSCP